MNIEDIKKNIFKVKMEISKLDYLNDDKKNILDEEIKKIENVLKNKNIKVYVNKTIKNILINNLRDVIYKCLENNLNQIIRGNLEDLKVFSIFAVTDFINPYILDIESFDQFQIKYKGKSFKDASGFAYKQYELIYKSVSLKFIISKEMANKIRNNWYNEKIDKKWENNFINKYTYFFINNILQYSKNKYNWIYSDFDDLILE